MSMWSPPVPALSALPVARGGVWGVLLPSLPGPGRPPFPGQRCGTAPGARESQIAKTPVASTPIWEAGCPPASAFSGPWAVPGAQAPAEGPWPTEPVAKPYLSCRPRVACLACQYFLPPYVPSSGPTGLPPCPQAWCHHPQPGPSWTQPGQLWDQACTAGAVPSAAPTPPPWSGPWPRTHRSLSLLLLF